MSFSLILCPLAIAMSVSASSASLGLLLNRSQHAPSKLPVLTTRFADEALLKQTLTEHGLTVRKTGADAFITETGAGVLHYFRSSASQPYRMEVQNVRDLPALLDALESLNRYYGRNVQQYTCETILKGIRANGMKLDSQTVLEDDTILLTISV